MRTEAAGQPNDAGLEQSQGKRSVLGHLTTIQAPAPVQPPSRSEGSVDLYWLPLGAGGQFVRMNGRIFEALASHYDGRPALDLYHSALEVRVGGDRFVIEMGPEPRGDPAARGAVCGGPVGTRLLGRLRLVRYEVRRALGGAIPDIAEAVGGPHRVSQNVDQARRLLELIPRFPAATWGRDELRTGEMLNSNSLTSWLLAGSGHQMNTINCPAHGRAPGWAAGLTLAARERSRGPAPSAQAAGTSRQLSGTNLIPTSAEPGS